MNDHLKGIAKRVADHCDVSNVYVLTDVHSLGITDDDIMSLYRALPSQSSDDTHGGIYCTAWLHAVRLATGENAQSSPEEVGALLKMAYGVMTYLGQRSGHPADGSVADAVRACLNLGRRCSVANMDIHTYNFNTYGEGTTGM